MSDPNLSDRLEIIVDAEAEPVDVDDAVADFLIAFVRGEDSESRRARNEF